MKSLHRSEGMRFMVQVEDLGLQKNVDVSIISFSSF